MLACYFWGIDKMSKGTTKFEILKFSGKNFAIWKVKIHEILVKDGCAIALKGKNLNLAGMTDLHFVVKDEIAQADLLLAWEDKVSFNMQTANTIRKAL